MTSPADTIVPTQPPFAPVADADKGEITLVENKHVDEVDEAPLKPEPVAVSAFAHESRGQTLRKFWKPAVFCMFVSFGAMMDGYHNTIDGNIIANQGFISVFGTVYNAKGQLALNAQYVSMWGGIYSGCNIFGNLIGGLSQVQHVGYYGLPHLGKSPSALGVFSDRQGTVVELLATNYQHWAASKVFCGLAAGYYTTSLVIYNSEIAPVQIRGFLLATWALGNGLGQLVASVGLQILAATDHAMDYKRVLYTEFLMEGLFIIGLFIIPESPWHYARKDLHDKAENSLRKLYGYIDGYNVDAEYEVMRTTIEQSRADSEYAGKASWTEVVRGVNLRRFLISMAIPVAGKLTGSTVIFGYTSYFFQLAGLQNPFLASMIIYLVQLFFICLAFYTTDLVGRRPLLLGALVVVSIVNLSIGICGLYLDRSATQNGVIVLACIWITAYASGIAPIGPSYQSEASAIRLRAKTNSLSQAGGQVWGLIFNYTVPLMLADKSAGGAGWGVKTAFFFACTNTIVIVIFYFQMPEFKNRSYAELDELFQRRVPARKFKSTKTAVQQELERPSA